MLHATLRSYQDKALAYEMLSIGDQAQETKKRKVVVNATEPKGSTVFSGVRKPPLSSGAARSFRSVLMTLSGQRRCYKCNSDEHVKVDCPKPLVTCFDYGKEGHRAIYCWSRNKPAMSQASAPAQKEASYFSRLAVSKQPSGQGAEQGKGCNISELHVFSL